MKRVGLDLEPKVTFLRIIMTNSDKDDWKKFRRILVWVKNTIKYKRAIGASRIKYIFTWVDAVYDVNADMRSQIGGSIPMGWGVIHAKS